MKWYYLLIVPIAFLLYQMLKDDSTPDPQPYHPFIQPELIPVFKPIINPAYPDAPTPTIPDLIPDPTPPAYTVINNGTKDENPIAILNPFITPDNSMPSLDNLLENVVTNPASFGYINDNYQEVPDIPLIVQPDSIPNPILPPVVNPPVKHTPFIPQPPQIQDINPAELWINNNPINPFDVWD